MRATTREDVKECYYYLDNTPTHSYMKYLYKYPQAAFPYAQLLSVNESRTREEGEYELTDTGVFDGGRYFDVVAEYAKASPDDILIRISVSNRGPEAAEIHVLPTIWFRNTWSWGRGDPLPELRAASRCEIALNEPQYGARRLLTEGGGELLFTGNETNQRRFYGVDNPGFVKDGINDYVITAPPARSTPRAPAPRRRCITGSRSGRGRPPCCACGLPTASSSTIPWARHSKRSSRSAWRKPMNSTPR